MVSVPVTPFFTRMDPQVYGAIGSPGHFTTDVTDVTDDTDRIQLHEQIPRIIPMVAKSLGSVGPMPTPVSRFGGRPPQSEL